MASSNWATLALLALMLAASAQSAHAQTQWWYKRCPGGDYARTPDRCAPCTCGYRPGPGGGDCRQYPNNWCSCYQAKQQTCETIVDVAMLGGTTRLPLSTYCDEGFTCRNSETGPWCCPTTPIPPPSKRWKGANSRNIPRFCSNSEDPAYCFE